MTREQIDALEKLAKKATPVPWDFVDGRGWGDGSYRVFVNSTDPSKGYKGRMIISSDSEIAHTQPNYNDAAFLVALRNAWPELRELALQAINEGR